MNKTTLDFAIIASGMIGYFISIVLVTTDFYKSRANNYLSLSLFLLSTIMFLGWFEIDFFLFGLLSNIRLEYLFGITLFTYFLVQIEHEYLTRSWYKWLYFPFFFSILIEIFFITSSLFDFYNLIIDDIVAFIKDITVFIYNVFVIFWGRNLIKKSGTISDQKKKWLLRLNLFIMSLIIIWFVSQIEYYIFDSENSLDFLHLVLSVLFWWILYYGVFKLQIVAQKDEIHQYLVTKNNHITQPKKKIKEATTSKIITQLHAVMDQEELYKNPLLSRLDLANRLDTSEGYLSQIINQETNKSVIQFVNEYRIETAKNLLHDPVFNKYSVEAIGLESGFKSKSAFYSTFKTNMGMSPGAFRKLQ